MRWRYPKFGLRALLVMFFLVGLVCLQLRREWRDYNPDFVFEQNLARRIERAGGRVSWHEGVRFRRLFFSVDHSAEILIIDLPPYGQSLSWTATERQEIMRDIRRLRHSLNLYIRGPEFSDADFVNHPPLPSQIRHVHFDKTNLTWAGVDAATRQNKNLESITLSGCSKSPGFPAGCLQRLPKLVSVNVSQSPLTTSDMRELVSVPSMEHLSISLCKLDAAQFALVRDRNFKYLWLIGTTIDGERISPNFQEELRSRGTRTQFGFY